MLLRYLGGVPTFLDLLAAGLAFDRAEGCSRKYTAHRCAAGGRQEREATIPGSSTGGPAAGDRQLTLVAEHQHGAVGVADD